MLLRLENVICWMLPKTHCHMYIHYHLHMRNLSIFRCSRPQPHPPEKKPAACACSKYFIFSLKSFMHLPCPYVKDYTCQEYRAFFKQNSSVDLTFRILLEY